MSAAAALIADVWRPVIPAAEMVVFDVAGLADDAIAQSLVHPGQQARLAPAQLVVIGAYGAEDIALQMAFGRPKPVCGAVLIYGPARPLLAPLIVNAASRCLRLRVVWEAADSLQQSTILGELLACFRSAGLDAQGAVFDAPAAGWQPDQPAFSPGVRMGAAYLAELVALALTPGTALSR